jgi:hypothetical protein
MSSNGRPIPEMTEKDKARFWAKVDTRGADGAWCWEWEAARSEQGYGRFQFRYRLLYAHRVSVALSGVTVPDGMVVDHLCRNPACVNPSHLDVVPPRVNSLRGDGGAHNAVKVSCPRGRTYSTENTHVGADGKRRCRACSRQSARSRRTTRKAA